MLAYWVLFLVPASMALLPVKFDKNINHILWAIACLLGILVIGLRYQVGGDWDNYITYLDLARPRDFSVADTLAVAWGNATGYMVLNWIVLQLGMGIYAVNTFCAAIFTVGLMKYCRKQPMPWVALAAAVPYMVYGVAMGYTRQATAMGLFFWGLSFLREGKELKYLALLLVACTFHFSAIIMAPLALLTRKKIPKFLLPLFGFGWYLIPSP